MKSRHKLELLIIVLLAIAAAVIGEIPRHQQASNGTELTVAYLDIGQGDAILLTTPHQRHILIDGGPDAAVLTRLGEEMPFYDRTIDLVVASHNHADHITGLNEVLHRYQVNKMWISGAIHTTNEYLSMLQNIKDHKIPTEVVWQGKSADIDGVHLDVVFPLTSQEGTRPLDQHDATVVLRATFGQKHFLFTGDLNEGHEQAIVGSGVPLQADVLKVPHHGSATGLDLDFLDRINPQYAVIQVGKNNKYGHPAPSSLDKLTSRGIKTFRNDTNGTIRAKTDGVNLTVTAQK